MHPSSYTFISRNTCSSSSTIPTIEANFKLIRALAASVGLPESVGKTACSIKCTAKPLISKEWNTESLTLQMIQKESAYVTAMGNPTSYWKSTFVSAALLQTKIPLMQTLQLLRSNTVLRYCRRWTTMSWRQLLTHLWQSRYLLNAQLPTNRSRFTVQLSLARISREFMLIELR